jgi:hypothetical protein
MVIAVAVHVEYHRFAVVFAEQKLAMRPQLWRSRKTVSGKHCLKQRFPAAEDTRFRVGRENVNSGSR